MAAILFCAGDFVGIGPFLNETVDLIRNIKKLTIVKGNHERYIFEDFSTEIMNDTEIEHYQWESLLLTDVNRAFLKEIPYEISIIIDEVSIRVVHYSMNEQKKYNEIINNPTIEDIKIMFKDYSEDIIIYGHDHSPNVVRTNNQLFINAGSLGCPSYKKNIANAGVLTIEDGKYLYEQLEIEYDSSLVVSKILELNYPASKEILKYFYGITDENI